MAVTKVSQAEATLPDCQSRMTPEAQAALAAPLDPAFIKTRKGDNGKEYHYADLDYLEGRAREVDPEWSSHLSHGGPNVLVMDITILGVTHSASAGYYIGDTYEVWDYNSRTTTEKAMTSRVAHTTIGAAEAACERRCFAKFRLGEELWKKDLQAESYQARSPENQADSPASGGQARSGGGGSQRKEPSPAALKMLTDMGVPEAIARSLNAWGRGKNPKTGYPLSDASEVIDALKEARGSSKGAVTRQVWEPIVSRYVTTTGANDDDDYDEQWSA